MSRMSLMSRLRAVRPWILTGCSSQARISIRVTQVRQLRDVASSNQSDLNFQWTVQDFDGSKISIAALIWRRQLRLKEVANAFQDPGQDRSITAGMISK